MSRPIGIQGGNAVRNLQVQQQRPQHERPVDFAMLTQKFKVHSNTYAGNIVHVNGDLLTKGGVQGSDERKKRSKVDKEANDRARSEFLEALGRSVGLEARRDGAGKLVFNSTYFKSLKTLLGSKAYSALNISKTFSRDREGHLTSGKPLTERRISRVYDALIAKETRLLGANAPTLADLQLKSLDTIIDDRHRQDFTRLNEMTDKGLSIVAVSAIAKFLGLPKGVERASELQEYFDGSIVKDVANALTANLWPKISDLLDGRTNWGTSEGDGAQFEEKMAALSKQVQIIKEALKPDYAPKVANESLTLERLYELCQQTNAEIPAEPPKLTFNHQTSPAERLFGNIKQMVVRLPDNGPFGAFKTALMPDSPVGCLKNMCNKANMDGMIKIFRSLLWKALPSGKTDREIKGIAESLLIVMSGCLKDVDDGTTLGDLTNLVKGDKDCPKDLVNLSGLDRILVSALYAPAYAPTTGELFQEAVKDAGGGLGCSNQFDFEFGDQKYSSTTQPQRSVDCKYGVKIDGHIPSLTGLSLSSLTRVADDEKPLVSFLRFGAVATNEHNRKIHYQQLVTQAFLNNPDLIGQAQEDGLVEVPIVRVDMALNSLLAGEEGVPDSFTLTFRKPNENHDTTVTLKPKIRHLFAPTDSIYQKDARKMKTAVNDKTHVINADVAQQIDILSESHRRSTLEAVRGLISDAQSYLDRTADLSQKDRDAIKLLRSQLEDYCNVLDDNRPLKWFEGCGAEMQRFGARAALLAAKIGQMPAVNCNWGRDRTGAMDNEIKMLAIKLTQDPIELQPIRLKAGEDDQDVRLRTQMLKNTGNWDIARQVNCLFHPINLSQTNLSGLDSLYDADELAREPGEN